MTTVARNCRVQTDAMAGILVLVKSRDHEEVAQVKLQVRRVDQTRYSMIVVASLSAVPQSCRTPLLLRMEAKIKKIHIERNPCDLKGFAHTPPVQGGRPFSTARAPYTQ